MLRAGSDDRRSLQHPHNVERQIFVEIDGVVQPAPAPRFSRTVLQFKDRLQRRGQAPSKS